MSDKELDNISGTVETIVFSNEDTGFTVMELEHDGELLTVVGTLPGLSPGEEVLLTGRYASHPTYGRQFKAEICQRTLPATASAIYKYLSSGAIKGIGPKTARRIVDFFGDSTLEIIEKEPERLAEIPRLSLEKAMQYHDEYKHIFGVRSVMLSLAKYGIDAGLSIKIWKQWGLVATDVIKENPYSICAETIGADFELADDIATTLGLSKDSMIRVKAGIIHVLNHNLFNGHCCLPKHQLIPTASALLGVDAMFVEDALLTATESDELISETIKGNEYIYLPHMYESEMYIAGRISLILTTNYHEKHDYQKDIDNLEKNLEIEYADLQRKAITMAIENNIFILTGGPGTGKTTTLNGILTLLESIGEKTALAAPTGRAAQRMSEVCQREAKTIHRLLEVDFTKQDNVGMSFKRDEGNPLRVDAIILDEVSMVDAKLFHSLLKALPLNCRLILVGDPDQLPSVGAGNILGDLIGSDVVPTVHLSEIFRQAKQSQIVISSHEIVRGVYPDLTVKNSDFFFMERGSYEATMATTLDLCSRRLPNAYGYSPVWDIQVITPSRVGALGTIELNRNLQEHLNPSATGKMEHRFAGVTFREKDKVMQTKNNYDIIWRTDDEEGAGIFNGDIGVIELIDRPSQAILIRYEDRVAEYHFDMIDQIEHAYAITVHKSQGSEFPAVVMPLMNYHQRLYYRNILYTGVTRAKNLMIILGRPLTISQMIDNNRKVLRYSNLSPILIDSVIG